MDGPIFPQARERRTCNNTGQLITTIKEKVKKWENKTIHGKHFL
jgi:hypothetical protein